MKRIDIDLEDMALELAIKIAAKQEKIEISTRELQYIVQEALLSQTFESVVRKAVADAVVRGLRL